MMTKEEYKKELVRMWDSVRDDKFKGRNNCGGVICSECQFCDIDDNDNDCYEQTNAFEMIEIVEKWSKEHPKPKYKVSQLEYDILQEVYSIHGNFRMYQNEIINNLREKGYFKGSCEDTEIDYYLKNCEVDGND